MAGVKNYDAKNNAGSFGGQWHHFELEQEMAKDAAKLEAAFRAVEAKLAGSPAPAAPAPAPAATPVSSGPTFPGDLDVGSKGASVKLVQAKVGAKADGDFGPGTGAKVSAWREANGLGKGTKVGPKTWKAMFG
jgi:peptidoglycan hydrolase-like protein with peptidoglycan-binding domain